MGQDYTIKFFKAGTNQDNYGNTWCNVVFEGIGEPVSWLVKDPSKVSEGDIIYGHIEETIAKSGKPYQRFKTDKKPDGSFSMDKKYHKDERQVTKNMVWKNLLTYYDVSTMTPDSSQWTEFWATVELHTDMLLPSDSTAPEKPKDELDEYENLNEIFPE